MMLKLPGNGPAPIWINPKHIFYITEGRTANTTHIFSIASNCIVVMAPPAEVVKAVERYEDDKTPRAGQICMD